MNILGKIGGQEQLCTLTQVTGDQIDKSAGTG